MNVAQKLIGGRPWWWDHFGRTVYRGHEVAVCEPYADRLNLRDFEEIYKIARAIGCRVVFDANSYHNPGYTIRIVFFPQQEADDK
jgi:hypothetical protein